MSVVTVFFRNLGLRWYEWIFMGVALAVVCLMYLMYNSLEATKVKLTQTQVTLEQTAHIQEYRNSLFDIDREIADKYIGGFPELLKAQREARKQLIGGYLILRPDAIETPSLSPVEPVVETKPDPEGIPERPVVTVMPEPIKVQPKTETPDDAFNPPPEDDVPALRFMVDGLYDAYCAAQQTDRDCTTGVSAGGV